MGLSTVAQDRFQENCAAIFGKRPRPGYSAEPYIKGLKALYFDILHSEHHNLSPDWTHTPAGTALSPQKAFECLNDSLRTERLILGLRAAIESCLERFPGERIRILYGGCGPVANLAMPQTTVFRPEQVVFYLLDIHAQCMDTSADIARALGKEDYFGEYIVDDAVTYQHRGDVPHIIVTETMNAGLLGEPQPAITWNLGPQLRDGGIFLPEGVTVSAEIKNSLADRPFRFRHPVYRLHKDSSPIPEDGLQTSFLFPERGFPAGTHWYAYWHTILKIFDRILLGANESFITKSLVLTRWTQEKGEKKREISVVFQPPGAVNAFTNPVF